jgi:hypothetical protein
MLCPNLPTTIARAYPLLRRFGRAIMYAISGTTPVPSSLQQHKYFRMIENLSNPHYLQELLAEESRLRNFQVARHTQFPELRSRANDLLQVWRLVTWAQAYHPHVQLPALASGIAKAEQLIELAFSHQASQTH